MKTFRDNGAIGALLDEYEKAVLELIQIIQTVSEKELTAIVDRETDDEDCRSIQTILSHVLRAGYGYIIYLRNNLGENLNRRPTEILNTSNGYQQALRQMFDYNVQFFEDYPEVELETFEAEKKVRTNWGQLYDVEQMMEHAIVHILRHRRQIERFLLKLRN